MTGEAVPLVIDLGSVAATVRRRALVVAGGVAAGLLAAVGVLLLVPPRFGGHALVLVRTSSSDPSALVKSRLGPIGELLPSSLGGGADQELATELSLLQSRAVLGTVVDSLRLEVVPKDPSRVAPATLVDSVRVTRRFKPQNVALVRGPNSLPFGTVWARTSAKVKLIDREDAIDELIARLDVKKSGGDAVAVNYVGRDSVTAAAVPNLAAAIYMVRRRTVDRGLNQRRLEFLAAKADSVRKDLRSSADVLASVAQENQTGTAPDIAARALADETGSLEARMSELRGSAAALDSLIAAVQTKRMDPRWLAGFPELLRSPALNDLISQIARVETERTVMLSRAAETAPSVIALAQARDSLVAQVLPIAISYRMSLGRQIASASADLQRLHAEIGRLPRQTAAVAKEQAEVTRLAQMNAGMGAQVLEARLAAMLEGGDVRVIDDAVSPRRPTFPRPLPTLAMGVLGGLLVGVALALLIGGGQPMLVATTPDASTRLRLAQAQVE
jgi:tyrosine-protein kinase Etk/Wzc